MEYNSGKFPEQDLDKLDWAILDELQEDAKLNIKDLAAKLNLTKTPVYERIKRLEQKGYIDKYTALVNRKKLGTSMVVFCFVTLNTQQLDKLNAFSTAVSKIPEVMECYLMTGQSDFILKVVVRDLDEYHNFSSGKLATLPNVSQINSSFVLNEIKQTTSFSFLRSI
jgi:DNA-binding Lrp family transcriptional regulator